MSRETEEQRHYRRVDFRCTATLALEADIVQLEIENLSLKGARFRRPESFTATPGSRGQLNLELADGSAIGMGVVIDHCAGRHLGVHWTEIDVDSLVLLRRLMELNTGDAEEIERELGQIAH